MSILRTTYDYFVEQGKLAKERLKNNRTIYKLSPIKSTVLKHRIDDDKRIIKIVNRMIYTKKLTPGDLYTLTELLKMVT
jgi:hypothetical protein